MMLTIATAISIAGAGYSLMSQSSNKGDIVIDEPMFPSLSDRRDEISNIEIITADETTTISNNGTEWVYEEMDNFPVDATKVNELIISITDLDLIESRTNNPENLHRLELNNITDDAGDNGDGDNESRATHIILSNNNGDTLADFYAGKRNNTIGQGENGGIYVHYTGQNQSWLARGEVKRPSTPIEFIPMEDDAHPTKDRILANFPATEISRIIRLNQGEISYSLTKNEEDNFTLDDLNPETEEMKSWPPRQLSNTLSSLRFEQVQAYDPSNLPPEAPTTSFIIPIENPITEAEAEAETEQPQSDTLTITLHLITQTEPSENNGDEEAEPTTTNWLYITATAETENSEATRQANIINQTAQNRIFKISQNKAEALTNNRADLIEQVETPEEG